MLSPEPCKRLPCSQWTNLAPSRSAPGPHSDTPTEPSLGSENGSHLQAPDRLDDSEDKTEEEAEEFKSNAAIFAAAGLVIVAGAGFYFKDQIW